MLLRSAEPILAEELTFLAELPALLLTAERELLSTAATRALLLDVLLTRRSLYRLLAILELRCLTVLPL
ncbi:hypothetical protein FQZ97_1262940 [compost metagenome]